MACIKTQEWTDRVTRLLSGYSFNSYLKSAIDDLERTMEQTTFEKVRKIEPFDVPSNLPAAAESILVCLCVTNSETFDFAPAFLYLAGKQAFQPPDEAKAVLDEMREKLKW